MHMRVGDVESFPGAATVIMTPYRGDVYTRKGHRLLGRTVGGAMMRSPTS